MHITVNTATNKENMNVDTVYSLYYFTSTHILLILKLMIIQSQIYKIMKFKAKGLNGRTLLLVKKLLRYRCKQYWYLPGLISMWTKLFE